MAEALIYCRLPAALRPDVTARRPDITALPPDTNEERKRGEAAKRSERRAKGDIEISRPMREYTHVGRLTVVVAVLKFIDAGR